MILMITSLFTSLLLEHYIPYSVHIIVIAVFYISIVFEIVRRAALTIQDRKLVSNSVMTLGAQKPNRIGKKQETHDPHDRTRKCLMVPRQRPIIQQLLTTGVNPHQSVNIHSSINLHVHCDQNINKRPLVTAVTRVNISFDWLHSQGNRYTRWSFPG